ncbi:MAG TPA: hypothetical protein VLC08_08755 [Chitinolyticbacter sp.]|nr:hypothetical protein [Chitinolyticbacter sp.]
MRELISNLLAREKSPLLNPKTAQAWCKRIENLDPQTQLERIAEVMSKHLEQSRAPDFDTLQALVAVDNAAQVPFDAMCYQYVSNPRMAKDMEQRLWKDIVGYSQRMIESYQRFIEHEGEEIRRTAGFAEQMPLVLARSLHYIALQAKWHYFRFEKAPGKLWTLAHRFYRLSEVEGFDSNPFPLYPGRERLITSCADEYIQLLMLATLSANNLSVRQLDWVDQWLDQWSKLVQLNRRHQEERDHFCVNLQQSQGPQKIQPESQGEPFRYWSLFDLLHEVQDTLKKLEGGTSPADLGLGNECRTPTALELLKHVDVFWTMAVGNAQVQRSARHDVKKVAEVIHGLDAICLRVRADNEKYTRQPTETRAQVDYDELMDMRLYGFVSSRTRSKLAQAPGQTLAHKLPETQTWLMENESEGGFGATLRYSENQWIRPGVMLGVKLNNAENWQVCMVRRLERRRTDEVYAGIQILSSTPVAVNVEVQGGKHEAMAVAEYSEFDGSELAHAKLALYLPYRNAQGANVNTLILHASDYVSDRVYKVQARDRSFNVTVNAVMEKGVDWIWVTLQVIR